MYPIKFSDMDLKANRQGHLTDAQRKTIDQEIDKAKTRQRYVIGFFLGVTTFFGAFMIMSKYGSGFESDNIVLSVITDIAVYSLIVGLMGSALMLVLRLSLRTLTEGNVKTIDGIAHPSITTRHQVTLYYVFLKGEGRSLKTFQFQDADALSYFKEGEHYRVYYIESTVPYVLSLEPLSSDDAA